MIATSDISNERGLLATSMALDGRAAWCNGDVENLGLTLSLEECLLNNEITHVGDLIEKNECQLLGCISRFGTRLKRKFLVEIKCALNVRGLSLGMHF